MKHYTKDNIKHAQALRKNMTTWERKLWYCFLKDYPIRFQRQKAIGNYIVDFYCAQAGLAIELDGKWHYSHERGEADIAREMALREAGIEIVRFSNAEVQFEFDKICECIDTVVRKLKLKKDKQE